MSVFSLSQRRKLIRRTVAPARTESWAMNRTDGFGVIFASATGLPHQHRTNSTAFPPSTLRKIIPLRTPATWVVTGRLCWRRSLTFDTRLPGIQATLVTVPRNLGLPLETDPRLSSRGRMSRTRCKARLPDARCGRPREPRLVVYDQAAHPGQEPFSVLDCRHNTSQWVGSRRPGASSSPAAA